MKKTTGEPKYHHGDLRRAILDGALEVIAESGMQNLSLREVARKIGVTTGAPYHHFKDRGELLLEVARQGFEQLLRSLETARDGSGEGLAEIEVEARTYLRFGQEHAAVYTVMFSREMAEDQYCAVLKPIADRSFLLVCGSVARAYGFADRKTAEAALSIWSMLHGLVVLNQSRLLQEAPSEQERVAVRGVLAVLNGYAKE